jgi:hypothetical protein
MPSPWAKGSIAGPSGLPPGAIWSATSVISVGILGLGWHIHEISPVSNLTLENIGKKVSKGSLHFAPFPGKGTAIPESGPKKETRNHGRIKSSMLEI